MAHSDRSHTALPKVVATSVIRSTFQGQSHGGVYLIDLEVEKYEQLIDWNDGGISWEGRGGDRGLRGMAFWNDEIYLAASDEVFVYDRSFAPLRSFGSRYLRHCHEIDIVGDRLYVSSCGFDSILEYDLASRRFTAGYCLRAPAPIRVAHRAVNRSRRLLGLTGSRPPLRLTPFDPEGDQGPRPADTLHVNSVTAAEGVIYVAGTLLQHLYAIRGGRMLLHAPIPAGTHNARPWLDGVLLNDTAADKVVYQDLEGGVRAQFEIRRCDPADLENVETAGGTARQGFGRGLAPWRDRYLIAGSSPATISVYDLHTGETVRSVNLSMDVRNAIHGLEVWPFDD